MENVWNILYAVSDNWEVILPIILASYEYFARKKPTEKDITIIGSIYRILNLVVENKRKASGNDEIDSKDPSKNTVSVKRDKIILTLALLLTASVLFAQPGSSPTYTTLKLKTTGFTPSAPSGTGIVKYDSGHFLFRDATGWYNPRTVSGSSFWSTATGASITGDNTITGAHSLNFGTTSSRITNLTGVASSTVDFAHHNGSSYTGRLQIGNAIFSLGSGGLYNAMTSGVFSFGSTLSFKANSAWHELYTNSFQFRPTTGYDEFILSSTTGTDSDVALSFSTKGLGQYRFYGNSSQESTFRLYENTTNGSNYAEVHAPSSIASNYVLSWPTSAGTIGLLNQIGGKNTNSTVTSPTSGEDGYSITWDNSNSRYTLTNVSGGGGGVTSVGITAPAAGITVSGSPITSSGSMTLALADDLAAVEGLSATGIVRRTASNTWSAGTAVGLTTEVTGRLPYANLTAATTNSVLLGRGSASSGDWQELTLGSGLSMSGTTLSAPAWPLTGTGTFTGNVTIAQAGNTLTQTSTLGFNPDQAFQTISNNGSQLYQYSTDGIPEWRLYNTSGTELARILYMTPGGSGAGIRLRNPTGTAIYNLSHNISGNYFWISENGPSNTLVSIGAGNGVTPQATLTVRGRGTSTGAAFRVENSSGTARIYAQDDGDIRFIGKISGGANSAATAVLHLAAGSTSASSAPLKFTSGSLMTTPEAGAVEFLTDKIYFTTTTGPSRREIALNESALTSGAYPVANGSGRLADGDITTTNINTDYRNYVEEINLTANSYTTTATTTAGLMSNNSAYWLVFTGTGANNSGFYYGFEIVALVRKDNSGNLAIVGTNTTTTKESTALTTPATVTIVSNAISISLNTGQTGVVNNLRVQVKSKVN